MPRPEKYVSRGDLGWGASGASYADPKKGLVVHYDGSNQNLAAKDHSACIAYWKNTRKFHTGPARGWADIGYSWGVCPHSYVFEGRGLYKSQAAQPGGNSTYYSVTLMCGPDDEITDAQINAVRQLREWLMEPATSISGTVKGHRDFVSTSCPGDRVYRMVRDGVFSQPARWGQSATAPPSTSQEDDMPHYLNMAHTKATTIPPGKYVSLRWDTVWTDTAKTAHKDGLAVMSKPGDLAGALWLQVDGLTEGGELHVRMVDWVIADREYRMHPPAEGVGTGGLTQPCFPVVHRLVEGRTMDLRVYNVGSTPLTLRRATFKGHVWLR